jgi:peroxiredoxin
MPLMPGQTAPLLAVPTLGGKYWKLGQEQPTTGTLIFFYRGLSCPVSESCVIELDRRRREFEDIGTEIIAISSDTEAGASAFAKRVRLRALTLGYDLPTEMAVSWGLYLSETIPPLEERIYNEPGLFLVRADGIVHCATAASMPIWRPDLDAALAQFADLEHKKPPLYHTTLVPVVVPEREQLSFRNGRSAPPIWRPS